MRSWNIELTKTVLADEKGMPLVRMLAPEGWAIHAYRKDIYRGYRYPQTVQILMRSPDHTCVLYWCSPIQGFDNHLEEVKDFTVDSLGNLNCRFRDLETQLEARAQRYVSYVGGAKNLKLVKQIDYSTNEERRRKRYEDEVRRFETSELNVISDFYYKGGIQMREFCKSGTERFYTSGMTVEGATRECWRTLPPAIVQGLQDPFMGQMMKSSFPHARFSKEVNSWIYTASFYTGWTAKDLLEMDCLRDDRQELYQKLYAPVNHHGVLLTDELRTEFERIRKEGDARRARRNEEKKSQEQAQRRQREAQAQRTRDAREKLRQTQKEISDIRRATYESQQKSQAKTREIWSDTLRGDTRFVDRHGNEHVLHTYDRYAYKNGDTYVSSDSKLDHDWDWEEFEKKKY